MLKALLTFLTRYIRKTTLLGASSWDMRYWFFGQGVPKIKFWGCQSFFLLYYGQLHCKTVNYEDLALVLTFFTPKRVRYQSDRNAPVRQMRDDLIFRSSVLKKQPKFKFFTWKSYYVAFSCFCEEMWTW